MSDRRGLIICLLAGTYTIYDLDSGEKVIAKPRGVFRIKGQSPKVGDFVKFQGCDDVNFTITDIEKRNTDLIRPAICNISQAFIVFSVKEPELNLNLLDRFLTILEFSRITPIIVFNKWDLLEPKEIDEVEKIINYYQSIGYTCIKTSAKQKIISQLTPYIDNKISVITGQSGVGKSSLLNVIDPTLTIKTNDISKALNRGKHTTRHVELIKINDGWLADTPGFGTMDFIDMSEYDISHSFIEFFEASSKCKYHGCLHLNEPNCEVKRKVSEKEILPSRYENYTLFISEAKKQRKW